MAAGKFNMQKASGGVASITVADGVGATNIVLPESGTVTTTQYVDARVNEVVGQLSTDYYQGAYGISWDYATDTYIRTGAKGYTAIQSLMKRCVVKADGSVNYYLHPDNSNFKEDGTPSILTGADGNVMVKIPKFYFKYTYVNGVHGYSISKTLDAGYTLHQAFIKDGVEVNYRYYPAYTGYNSASKIVSISGVTPTRSLSRTTFRTYAKANGTGWGMIDYNLLYAIQILLLIELCTFNSQSILGTGNYTGDNTGMTTGGTNLLGNKSSTYSGDGYMSYRGIENFYGDCWKWIDGININNRLVYINNKSSTFADDVYTGDYISTGITMPVASGGYISNFANTSKGFIPSAVTGSSSTYVTDGLWTETGSRAVLFGGDANGGLLDGAFYVNAYYAASYVSVAIGGGVSF